MRQRPGVEPADWNGSSVNQKVSGVTKQEQLIFNAGGAVKMVNTFVGIKILWTSVGSVAPGFVTLGTPWVYAVADVDQCDGGVYGGVDFSCCPDAVTGRYKRKDTTGEKSHVIAYLWNGTYTSKVGSKSSPSYTRDDVARAIIGKTTPTNSGALVASCDYTFTSTNGEWQTITVPLEYVDGMNSKPTKMNVIISGGDYWSRSNMKEGTTLLADDIRFVYYSTLKTLSYDGVDLPIPPVGEVLDLSSVEYDDSKDLVYTLNGRTASAVVSYDEATAMLEIVVSNVDSDVDGLSSHTYYIQFAKQHTHGAFNYIAHDNRITVLCGECNEDLGTVSMLMPADLTYDGAPKEVVLNVSVPGIEPPIVTYSSGMAPVNVGVYTASIAMGDAVATMNIVIEPREISGASVGEFLPMTYNGMAQVPQAVVLLEGYGEVTGTWSEVINVCDTTYFTATGNYVGVISLNPGMTPMKIENLNIDGLARSYEYTGEAIEPSFEVKNGEVLLIENVDYTISYMDNVDVGTATLTLALMGNYCGTIVVTFDILETSKVDVVVSDGTNVAFYGLEGCRVFEPVKGAVYIINGKKVLW
ncbi:MAG: hypothetical protein E7091_01295 [Bacteroidales bacterium]|nr:hypothetical protein [Bacteroidales bacterium]